MFRGLSLSVLLIAGLFVAACSSSVTSPILPDPGNPGFTQEQGPPARSSTSKAVWGIWEISIDTDSWEATIVPIRGPEFTVDVVTFLQPPAGDPANLALAVTDVSAWLTQGLITCEVGLRHPFPGLDEYTGFDVYGAFMAPGSIVGQYDSDVLCTNGDDEPILLNADGYTRWMNPTEFPDTGTILDFTPGKLSGDDVALFTSTINGYKYFADGLEVDQDVGEFLADTANADARGAFRPGSFNEREYQLKFPMVDDFPYLIFQYAVIASWVEPDTSLSGDPDMLDVPGDFPLSANADEAIYLGVTDNSTLYYMDGSGGGDVNLELEVFDWGSYEDGVLVPDEIFKIVVEGDSSIVPGGYAEFDQATLAANAAPGSSIISSVFEVEITGCTPQSGDDVPLLITVESFDPDTFDPGTGTAMNDDRLAAYFLFNAAVGTIIPDSIEVISPNGGETLWMAMSHDITWDPGGSGITDIKIEWSTDNFVADIRTIIDSTENDGSFIWAPIPVEETATARIRITDVLGAESDISDGDFAIALPVWLAFETELQVDPSTASWVSWPSYYHPGEEFSPVIAQNTDGMVHVIWYNLYTLRTNEPHIRSMTGTTWQGQGSTAGIGGGTYPQVLDYLKIAPDQNGRSWIYLTNNFWWGWVGMHTFDVDRLWGGNTGFCHTAIRNTASYNIFGELGSDSSGYCYIFADNQVNGSIYFRKTSGANNAISWGSLQLLTNDGYVSQSRSWARPGSGMALIFTTGSGDIRLAETTDAPTNNTWDATEVVWDGSGYSNVKNVALQADSSDRLFAAWTAQEDATSDYHVFASMRETVDGPWSDPVIIDTSVDDINDVHIHSAQVDLPTGTIEDVAVVSWETDDTVYSALSPLDLMAFLPDQMVTDTETLHRDPDVMCIGDTWGYQYDVLFAYSWDDSGNWDIAIRNADFETP